MIKLKKLMKKILTTSASALVLAATMIGSAHAQYWGGWGGYGRGYWGGWGGWSVPYIAPPVYIAPPPVYVAPPPVYVAPPVVPSVPPIIIDPGTATEAPLGYRWKNVWDRNCNCNRAVLTPN